MTGPNISVLDSRLIYNVNDTIVIECDEGYQVQGQQRLVCQESGKWNGSMPTCIGKMYYYLKFVFLVYLFSFSYCKGATFINGEI